MGPRKTSDETRKKVIQKFLQNFSESKSLKDLLVSKPSVHRIIVAYKQDGSFEREKAEHRKLPKNKNIFLETSQKCVQNTVQILIFHQLNRGSAPAEFLSKSARSNLFAKNLLFSIFFEDNLKFSLSL